jgi:hypothetical protein
MKLRLYPRPYLQPVLDEAARRTAQETKRQVPRRGGMVRGPGVRVVTGEMEPGYAPPSTSMNPDSVAVIYDAGRGGPDRALPCRHSKALPVESVLGDVVAWLCPHCDQQLSAEWTQP